MAVTKQTVLPREMSLLRIIAQGLVPEVSSGDIHSVVKSLLAVQGQQVSALPHALLVRCPGAVGSDVAREFDSHRLVRSRPMRGTVHVTTAEDYHWMRLTLNAKPSPFIVREEGGAYLTEERARQGAEVAWALIERKGGKVGRADLFGAWLEHVGARELETKAERTRFCNLLMWRLDRTGEVVEAPMGVNQHYFIDARKLPAADSEESGFRMTPEEREHGLVEVARRYAIGHGPVSVEDLARWAGINKSMAFSSLEAAVRDCEGLARFRLADDKLSPASAPQNLRLSGGVYYLRADLPDLLSEFTTQAKQAIFLPSFDELHVGYKNRTCLTDEVGERLICPNKNGMFHPLIVEGGRLVGVRPVAEGLQWMGKPSKRLQVKTEKIVSEMKDRLAR